MSCKVVRNIGDTLYITIPKFITPDFSIEEHVKKYDDYYDYYNLHFCIEELLLISEECNEEGIPKSYCSPTVSSIKIENGVIFYLHRENGWIPHMLATKKYAEILAEKALLE